MKPGLSRIVSFVLLLGGVLYSANVISQPHRADWKDYHFMKHSDAWLTGENAAGLKALMVNDISSAEINFNKSDGKFTNYYQSSNSYEVGANVESFYRLNPQIVFFGKISYDNFQGKNMGGSVFIDPTRTPFDIVEFADTTRGGKKLENFHLIGAVSANIYKGIILGAKVDFTATNYAKDKDLRHKNKLSDMFVTTGLSYSLNNMFEVGANYYYQRRVEGVELKMYGTTEKRYTSLLSYGGFYGKGEEFGGTGYTAKDEEKPLFDKYHGTSLQLRINFSPKLNLHNEFAYKTRDGHYGKRATSGIVYSEHHATIVSYKGKLNYHYKNHLHSLDINIENEKLENLENVYKINTEQGSAASRITYYDPLEVADKAMVNGTMEYTANLGISDFNPTWILKGGLAFFSRKQTLSLYPFYRKQIINQTNLNLAGSRNIIIDDAMYSILLGVSYTTGTGTPKEDGLYSQPEESHTEPKNSDYYLYREYEYLTNDQITANIGFKYSRLFPNIGIKGYAAANYSFTKAFDVRYLDQDNFSHMNFTLGCTF